MNRIIAGNKLCVASAISTLRMALGYTDPCPKISEQQTTRKVATHFREWFPNHSTMIWCEESIGKGLPNWQGSDFSTDLYDGTRLIVFDYSPPNNPVLHMVIGCPALYDGYLKTSFIGAVEIKPIHKNTKEK